MKYFYTLVFLWVTFFLNAQQNYTVFDISEELSKDANSILIDEKVVVDVSVYGKMNYHYYGARAVLNKNGDKDVQRMAYYDKDSHIGKIELSIYDAFGNKIEHFKKRDFHDISRLDNVSIYTSDRMLYVDYVPTTYPYIAVFSFESDSKSTGFIPSWAPIGWYGRSTKNSTYKLKFDPNNKPRIQTKNLEGYTITISESPNELIFTGENISPVVYEDLSLPFSNKAPKVNFSLNKFTLNGVSGEAKNWSEFGSWMQNSLLNDVEDLSPTTINKVKNLIKNETSNQAKARIVYDYLQKKVRYVSVQIGIGGWKPMLASEVDRLSYGDCKALTNYTKALLDAVGIPSYYTIIYAGDQKKNIAKDFSRIQGNHAILAIPDGEEITWLECTSQDKPYGFLGTFTDDRDALIVTPEGGKIIHTKNYEYHENLEESYVEINVNRKGGAKAHYDATSRGLRYGEKYRILTKNKKEIEDTYKNKWGGINGYTLDSLRLTDNKEKIIFKENVILDIPSYTISVGNDILVNVNLFNQNKYIPTRVKNRIYPLYIDRGFEDKNTIILNLPQGHKIGILPENQTIENEFGMYKVSFTLISENSLEYKRHLIIKKGTFPKESYDKYRSFRKKISRLDNTKLLVSKIH